eukprot:s684_g4.t1
MFCDHVPSGLPPHGIRSVRGFRLGSFWATRPTTGRLAEERPRRRWKSQASYGLAAVGCRVWATWEGRMKATQRNCQASLAELRRDAPPFVTQLRRVPTESRDLHVFLEDAVADGEVVEVLEVQGEFARVLSPDRRCGWVQSRYLQFSAPETCPQRRNYVLLDPPRVETHASRQVAGGLRRHRAFDHHRRHARRQWLEGAAAVPSPELRHRGDSCSRKGSPGTGRGVRPLA